MFVFVQLKKFKSKADKVYITFKGHFKMLSIKGELDF